MEIREQWQAEIVKILTARCSGKVVTAAEEVIELMQREMTEEYQRGKRDGAIRARFEQKVSA